MSRCKSDKNKLKEGRGLKREKDYIGWIKVREVSSMGRSHRIKGLKHDRIYHFLSDLEYYYALLLFWNDDVVEIREQYPLLPKVLTKHIANEKKIRHPSFLGNDVVMTTDFLITIKEKEINKDIVRTIKYSKDLQDKRTIEKLLIERDYFSYTYGDGFSWAIVTENEIDIIKAKNIDSFYQDRYWYKRSNYSMKQIENMVAIFIDILYTYDLNVKKSILKYTKLYGLLFEDGIAFLRYLIITKAIKIDMSTKFIRHINDILILPRKVRDKC